MENLMKRMGNERYHSQINKLKANSQESQTPYGIALSKGSMPSLCRAVQKWFESGKLAAGYNRDVAILLEDIPSEVIADLTCRVVLDCISVNQPLTATAMRLGKFLEEEARLRALKKEAPDQWNLFESYIKKRVGFDYKKYSARALAARLNLNKDWENWSTGDRCRCGLVFIDLFQKSTGLVEMTTIIVDRLKQVPHLRPTDKAQDWIKRHTTAHEDLAPIYLPASTGKGYRSFATCSFKVHNKNHLDMLESSNLSVPYGALNKLQNTPWQINHTVLETVKHFWDNQYSVAGIPAFKDDLKPPKPHDIETNKESRDNWRKEAAKFYREDLSLRGSRLGISKILWVADKFKGEEFMFFPHQFDFRGRSYAVPNFLNYQTIDLSKGLLQFSKATPITERAYERLLEMGHSLWGGDEGDPKVWVSKNEDNIHSVASNPKGDLWWSQADDPWQFLGWTMEASRLLRGTLRETKFPVSVDASSNGLQIMSMLTRYRKGAEDTNCVSSLHGGPKDIYSKVLTQIEHELQGSTLGNHWLTLKLDRKLIKSIIMTIPYGITKFRATDLVLKWYWAKEEDVFGKRAGNACEFIATIIVDTFYRMYPEFNKLMKFFGKMGPVEAWKSPSGFPVVQHYRKTKLRRLKSLLFGRIRSFNYFDEKDEVDTAKMKRAFTPNFVHCLDAAVLHMALNRFNGPCVASVHDSFATHATHIDDLKQHLRDANADVFNTDPEVFWKKIFSVIPLEKQAFTTMLGNFSSITGDLVVDEIRHSAYMYR